MTDTEKKARIAEQIRTQAVSGKISCASALTMARAAGIPTSQMAGIADDQSVRITGCRLGLFGKKAPPPCHREDKRLVVSHATKGAISCSALHRLSRSESRSPLRLAAACNALGIRITDCELGVF